MFKLHRPSAGTLIATGALVLAGSGTAGAAATGLLNGSVRTAALHNGAVTSQKLHQGAVSQAKLSQGVQQLLSQHAQPGPQGPEGPAGPKGDTGAQGATGAAGASGFAGAFYSVEDYPAGGDGWATVACDPNSVSNSEQYTAISGGVEEDDAPGNNGPQGSSVIASFPGRMDWSTNSPIADRLDGWVIGLSGGDNSPLKVWALCVPRSDFGGTVSVVVNSAG